LIDLYCLAVVIIRASERLAEVPLSFRTPRIAAIRNPYPLYFHNNSDRDYGFRPEPCSAGMTTESFAKASRRRMIP
jgi:hypothetical protein